MKLGKIVRRQRMKLGISQTELARRAGMRSGDNGIYMIESSRRGRHPSANLLVRLARAMNMNVIELMRMLGYSK